MIISNKIDGIEVLELPTNWPVGPVNLFLIFGEKLTLVDCGRRLEPAWEQFNSFLGQLGLSVMDIEQIVLTHHHGDHIGLLDWILDKNPIPVYAHANCRPYLTNDSAHFENGNTFFKQFYKEFGIPAELAKKLSRKKGWNQGPKNKIIIEQELDEGVAIPGLSEWQVIETKGHAQSHISLYRPRDQVLLCGDHLIKHSPAGIFLEPPIYPETERSKPLIQYVNNLHKLLRLPVKLTLSGHGERIDDLPELINETFEKIDKRALRIKKLLVNQQKNGLEIVKELYPNKYEDAVVLLASDTVGLLDLLLDRKEIAALEIDGVIYYSA
ncbi:MBL fold metallo-hydrolase [Mesobacillus harenae]|uniref:MBL fold metallo-hydrolase n=1 Tax=Mesobacillus harenae TaxID=2213203 RepID=UPI001580AEE9|nr:MBL fold metallo-hydrolase [Mesobacillus harenae]